MSMRAYLCRVSGHQVGRYGTEDRIPACEKAKFACKRCGQTFTGSGAPCDYSPPEYADRASCELRRVCRVCGGSVLTGETRHDIPRYGSEENVAACEKGRVFCRRCRKPFTGSGGACEYGPPVFAGEKSCKLQRVCRACGGVEPAGEGEHGFGDWEPMPARCMLQRRCARCGEQEFMYAEHRFGGATAVSDCVTRRACQVCGDEEITDHHQFENTGERTRRCRVCGHQEEHGTPVFLDY